MTNRKKTIALAAAALAVFRSMAAAQIQELRIIDSPHKYDLNPRTAAYNTEAQILAGVYEGLFSYDPVTLEPKEALAESCRISRDKTRWTFTMREGAKFSDGSAITAADARESLLDLIVEKNAPYASMLDVVKGAADYRTGKGPRENVGIRAPDEKTLSLSLERPAGYLRKVLCHSAFSVVKKNSSAFSGPFVIKSYADGVLVLEKNAEYWDAENTKLSRITITQSEDGDDNARAFNYGDAQWVAANVDTAKIYNKSAIQISAQFATEYLFFKCREGSVWNDSAMRAALLAAVPWDALREKAIVKADTLVYPLQGYPDVDGYEGCDAEEAALLMKEARRRLRIPQDERVKVAFAITDGDYMMDAARILEEAWSPLGVDLEVERTPRERYLRSIPGWDADLFSYTWIGDFADPLSFLELFGGDSTLNVTGWKNDKFDSLVEEAASHTDEEREKLLARAEQTLLDSALILPISHPVSLNIINTAEVGGWSANAFDLHPFKYLYIKETEPRVPNVVRAKRAHSTVITDTARPSDEYAREGFVLSTNCLDPSQ